MFTGLIEEIGRVKSVKRSSRAMTIRIEASAARETSTGDSISVNGACLTAIEADDSGFSFEAVKETVSATTLGFLKAGDRVNIERALRADSRLGGHFVYGHVDAVAGITGISGGILSIKIPREVECFLVPRASIAVDGISLTLQRVMPPRADIALIPYTLEHTTMGSRKAGDSVNIEVDFIAKQVITLIKRYSFKDRRE